MDSETRYRIERLQLKRGKPLVICDVDEVVVHFVRGLEDWLAEHDLWLDPASFALEGNVRRRKDNSPLDRFQLEHLLGRFFAERVEHLAAMDGAAEALSELSTHAEIVMLTNLPHSHYEARRRNLSRHGMDYPLITNTGPKGPAVRALGSRAGEATVFIDDHPDFLASARSHCPDVALVHFMHDERFSRHVPPVKGARARVSNWREARVHVAAALGVINGTRI